MIKLKKFNYERVLLIVFSIMIFFYYGKDISDIKSITIIGDEFGYWNAGAWIAGRDWSLVTRNNAYYSYGYGVILAPLFFALKNSIHMYQAALVLNAICIVVSFLLLYNIVKRLVRNDSKYIVLLASLAFSFSSNILFFSKVTMCEIWGITIFLIVCYAFLNFADKINFRNAIILGLSAIYLFFVHQRMIGITITVLCYIVWKCLVNNKKLGLTVILLFVMCLLLGGEIKNTYRDYYYSVSNENVVLNTEETEDVNGTEKIASKNDFNGQIEKIKYVFSMQGIKNLFLGVCGKIFYLGSESYLLLYFGVLYITKELRHWKKNEQNSEFYAFIIVNLFISIVISTLFTIRSYDVRVDNIFYGRYNEQFLSLLAVLGCVGMINGAFSKKETAIVFFIELVLGILLMVGWLMDTNANDFNFSTVISMADIYYQKQKSGLQTVFSIFLLRTIVIALIIQTIKYLKTFDYIKILLVSCVIVFMGIHIYADVKNGIFSYRIDEQETNLALAEVIADSKDEVLNYCASSEHLYMADYMQYILRDREIVCYTDLENIEEGIVLTYINDAEINTSMETRYHKIGESRRYILWRK